MSDPYEQDDEPERRIATELDIANGERRIGEEIHPMRDTDKHDIRQAREDEWESLCKHGFGMQPAIETAPVITTNETQLTLKL